MPEPKPKKALPRRKTMPRPPSVVFVNGDFRPKRNFWEKLIDILRGR